MQSSSYLTFRLNYQPDQLPDSWHDLAPHLTLSGQSDDILYGIPSDCVEEVLPLPALTLIPELPETVAGMLNVRGELIAVIDMNTELGWPKTGYQLSNTLIIVTCNLLRVGLIVQEVLGVRDIQAQEMMQIYRGPEGATQPIKAIAGITPAPDELVLLHPLEKWVQTSELIRLLDVFEQLSADSSPKLAQAIHIDSTFVSSLTEEELAILRRRADSLMPSLKTDDRIELESVAVFELANQVWATPSKYVQEFIDVSRIMPIPCCPPHIIGNTNFRGKILTILDIRHPLNLPTEFKLLDSYKAMIVETEDLVAAILVDEIRDATLLLNVQDIISTSTTMFDNQYLQGVATYDQTLMGIIDLPKLIAQGGLVVDETV